MNELDLRALQLTQQAVLRLINEVAERTKEEQRARELMTVGEAADALRISRWHFYHVYRQIGLSPVKRIGRKLLFRRAEVLRLLDRTEARIGRPPNRLRLSVPKQPALTPSGNEL